MFSLFVLLSHSNHYSSLCIPITNLFLSKTCMMHSLIWIQKLLISNRRLLYNLSRQSEVQVQGTSFIRLLLEFPDPCLPVLHRNKWRQWILKGERQYPTAITVLTPLCNSKSKNSCIYRSHHFKYLNPTKKFSSHKSSIKLGGHNDGPWNQNISVGAIHLRTLFSNPPQIFCLIIFR